MTTPDLPHPISVTDEYLAAIHDVLGEIRDRLPEGQQDSKPGVSQVSEPGRPRKRAAAPEATPASKE